jgi:hypothetical protein
MRGGAMVSELYPIQFIEGINENEEVTDKPFMEYRDYGIAVLFTPNFRYNLTRIEIYGSVGEKSKPHKAILLTDHNGAPSKTAVAEGRLLVPTELGEDWLPVELSQPVVVFTERKYWLAFPEHPLTIYIGYAKEGKELIMVANPYGVWGHAEPDVKRRVMLRFFGRALPT